jgi:hypothetical protein
MRETTCRWLQWFLIGGFSWMGRMEKASSGSSASSLLLLRCLFVAAIIGVERKHTLPDRNPDWCVPSLNQDGGRGALVLGEGQKREKVEPIMDAVDG